MRRRSVRICFSCAFSLLAFLSPLTVAAQEKKSALAIFDAALGAFDNQRLALRSWQYHQTLVTHQMDSAGNVVASGTWQSIVRPGDPRPLEYTASHVEGKLSFFKAQASSSAGPSGTQGTKTTEEKNQVESAVEAVRKYNLRDRYNWKRLPDENVAGESAYVIGFEPKPRQNTKSREERFFGLLAGRVWVSRSDYSLLKAEAALQSPCHLFWIIARAQPSSLPTTLNLRTADRGSFARAGLPRKQWSRFPSSPSGSNIGLRPTSSNRDLRGGSPPKILRFDSSIHDAGFDRLNFCDPHS